ncbi:hypothetical protein OSTOST_24511, partial [Ostertagia ostertagi]
CMFFVKILGPVVGLLVGSKLNEIYYTFDQFFSTVRLLFRNPIYVGAMLGRIVDVLAFKGFFVFLGKYLEIQFGVPQYRIQKYLAGTGVVGFACGVITGSVAMRKFHLQEDNLVPAQSSLEFLNCAIYFNNYDRTTGTSHG